MADVSSDMGSGLFPSFVDKGAVLAVRIRKWLYGG